MIDLYDEDNLIICKNCGKRKGLHQAVILACPDHDEDASMDDRKWKTTIFEPIDEEIVFLEKILPALETDSTGLQLIEAKKNINERIAQLRKAEG